MTIPNNNIAQSPHGRFSCSSRSLHPSLTFPVHIPYVLVRKLPFSCASPHFLLRDAIISCFKSINTNLLYFWLSVFPDCLLLSKNGNTVSSADKIVHRATIVTCFFRMPISIGKIKEHPFKVPPRRHIVFSFTILCTNILHQSQSLIRHIVHPCALQICLK